MTKAEPRDATLTMRIPKRLKDELEYRAERDDISVADIIVPYVDAILAAYDKKRDG